MKLIKMSFFTVVCLSLIACSPSANKMSFSVMPQELQDCKIFRLNDGFSVIVIARCPNSNTTVTYKSGKSTYSSAVIETE